jgi:hypothetical protein
MTKSPGFVVSDGSKERFKPSPKPVAQCGVSEKPELWRGWNLWRSSEIPRKHFAPVLGLRSRALPKRKGKNLKTVSHLVNKKNPSKIHPRQLEFAFTTQPAIHWAPPLKQRVLCCAFVPEQHSYHKFSGTCYADRLPLWMRLPLALRKKISSDGGKPPAEPQKQKAPEFDSDALQLLQERNKTDEGSIHEKTKTSNSAF